MYITEKKTKLGVHIYSKDNILTLMDYFEFKIELNGKTKNIKVYVDFNGYKTNPDFYLVIPRFFGKDKIVYIDYKKENCYYLIYIRNYIIQKTTISPNIIQLKGLRIRYGIDKLCFFDGYNMIYPENYRTVDAFLISYFEHNSYKIKSIEFDVLNHWVSKNTQKKYTHKKQNDGVFSVTEHEQNDFMDSISDDLYPNEFFINNKMFINGFIKNKSTFVVMNNYYDFINIKLYLKSENNDINLFLGDVSIIKSKKKIISNTVRFGKKAIDELSKSVLITLIEETFDLIRETSFKEINEINLRHTESENKFELLKKYYL